MKQRPTTNGKVSVTFELPAVDAHAACLCGDFNDWVEDAQPMRRRKDGIFATTMRLAPGAYQFRYLVDGDRWMNDWNADRYEHNAFGSDNSVVVVEAQASGRSPQSS